jgi:PKHD-type hydroxylase
MRLQQLLDADEVAQARRWLAEGEWVDGRTAGVQAAAVKRNEQLAEGPQAQRLRDLVLKALERQPLFLSAALPRRVLPPAFNRYRGERNEYGAHIDQAIRAAPGGPLRADLSCTLFLSPPDSYDGGELIVRQGHDGTEQAFKLAAGDALLYPASTVHRVALVTRGERLASFFWIESLVRHTEQRRILFDMDTALQQLRQRDGESAEAVALTGTYHNLLRLWAET